jgi:multicomponent Na+:H+ antiporter subunit D
MPWTMAAFTVASFGMIGAPPLAGFISKWYLGLGALEAGHPWVVAVLVASTALNAAYFLPILYTAWFRPPTERWSSERTAGQLETRWTLLLPAVSTAVLSIVTGLFAASPFSPLHLSVTIARHLYPLP